MCILASLLPPRPTQKIRINESHLNPISLTRRQPRSLPTQAAEVFKLSEVSDLISHLATVNISINVKKLISACRSKMKTGTVEEEEKEASLTHKSVFISLWV